MLGSVGEPINNEAWHWFHSVVGDGRCPLVDTWWQTETGGVCIAPRPAEDGAPITAMAMRPFFGIQPVLMGEKGEALCGTRSVELCVSLGRGLGWLAVSMVTTRDSSTPTSNVSWSLLHRRRSELLRGRILPDHWTHGRCHQRQRTPAGDGRDRRRTG
ncbi:hypothetical protein INR49_022659 [Caranx melampygus]|nr:hypothetical protein INR49_022659 [Caranx melampygus]